ncbi:MAG: hypothetical protein KAT05_15330 [Spirochaetes bacterium]|nr:hypothetical protein [Spirochaetota bacterium]
MKKVIILLCVFINFFFLHSNELKNNEDICLLISNNDFMVIKKFDMLKTNGIIFTVIGSSFTVFFTSTIIVGAQLYEYWQDKYYFTALGVSSGFILASIGLDIAGIICFIKAFEYKKKNKEIFNRLAFNFGSSSNNSIKIEFSLKL